MDQLVEARDELKAKRAKLEAAEIELGEKEAALREARTKLRKAKTTNASDPQHKQLPHLQQELDQAEEEVAEARLSVAVAKVDLAEAVKDNPLRLAELKWERAQAKFDVAKAMKEEESKDSLQHDIDVWRRTFEKLSAAPTAEGTSAASAAGVTSAAAAGMASGGPSDKEYLLVKARIENAKNMRGIRAAAYKSAEEHLARYFGSKENSFYYDGDCLMISVLFLSTDRAQAELFQTSLNHWHFRNFLVGLHGKVQVEKRIQVLQLSEIPQDPSAPATPQRVFFQEYDGADSESPMQTLEDFMGSHASSSTDVLLQDNDLVKFQSLESQDCFQVCEAYRMHIKDKAESSPDLRKNPNNLLAGSWTPFHQLFDGLGTCDQVPKLAIRFERVHPEQIVVSETRKRQRVDVALEFQSEQVEKLVAPRLKDGSEKNKLKDLEWLSFVYVEDVDIFKKCLDWKYKKTKKEWKKSNDK